MGGNGIVWGVALAIVIDLVMIIVAWRYGARVRERSFQASAGLAVCGLFADDDEDALDFASDDGSSHGLLTNPASGLPMLDGIWMDVAGNPYGTNFSTCSGSSSLASGGSGLNDL